MKVSAILAVRLVTAAPRRLAAFYTGLGFSAGEPHAIPVDEMALLGLAGRGSRLPLRLGGQRVDLDHFEAGGAPYPADVGGTDMRFQHIAIVTDDAAAAWRKAVALGATPISDGGPVTLPASSGGVIAVKFRDPERHPLEFLQFPEGTEAWRGRGLLGIDHSAISVADGAASRSFYESWGLAPGKATLNQGPGQARLDGLADPVVDVIPMAPAVATPHLELLAYRTSSARHAPRQAVNDVAATRLLWSADRTALVRDPDDHIHQLATTNGSME